MAAVKQRLEEFYALEGKDYGEVLQKLHAFGKTLDDDKSAFFDAITPRSWRDELFYIRLLQMHKMYPTLASVLLKENRISTKVILGDPNFIKYLYNDYPEIFGKLADFSYTLRAKLINKLSYIIDDEEMGFEIYRAVLNEFGLKIATPLLISCKENVIIEAITVNEVKFTERQLIHCHKKSAKLLEIYFKENPCFDQYAKLAQYLCMQDLKTFQSLLKYGAPKIGRKAFVRYIKEYKAEFVRDCGKLINLFRSDVLGRYLDEGDFVVFVKNLLPKSVDEFGVHWDLEQQLLMVPKKIRGRVIFSAFKELYGLDIWTGDEYCSDDLLRLIPLDDRRKFDLSDHVEFESAEVAIPALNQQLRFTTEQIARKEVFRKILECCKINDDMDALLKVMKDFSKNHSNERQIIRSDFIYRVKKYFRLDKFSSEHWACMDQIVMTAHVNGEDLSFAGDILEEFMKYKSKNGLDYTVEFKMYLEMVGIFAIPVISDNPEVQKGVILKYGSLMDKIFEKLYTRAAYFTYLSAVIDFNFKYPKCMIPLSYYKEYVKIVLKNVRTRQEPEFHNEIKLMRCVLKHPEDVDDILEEMLISFTARSAPYITIWILRNKPYILENNIEALFERSKIHNRCLYALANTPILSLHTKLSEYAFAVLKSPQEDAKKICNSITLLSFHKDVDLNELTRKWWPKPDCKIDVHEKGMKDLLEIQRVIISSFRNTFVTQNVDDILYFCNGDYTQYALEALYSALFNAPEKVLGPTIRKLLGKAVSVRKHALHLATYLCTLEHKRKLLNYFVEHGKNASVKRYILKKLFKCLLDDRTDHDWALFSSNLNLIDPNDKELVSELLSSKKIPKKFYTDFIKLIWTHLSSRDKSEEFQVLAGIDYKKFTFTEFCDGIVQKSLFNPANEHTSETHVFVYHYLAESKPSETIWNRILEASHRNDILESMKFQKELHELFKSICAQVLKAKTNFEIVDTALGKLQSLEIPQNKFGILVLLEVTLSCKPTNLPDAKMTVDRLNSLVGQQGVTVANCYGQFVREFVQLFEENEDEIGLDLALGALRHSDGIAARLLCLHLLPKSIQKNESIRKKLMELVRVIRDGATDVVAFELSKVVQNLEY